MEDSGTMKAAMIFAIGYLILAIVLLIFFSLLSCCYRIEFRIEYGTFWTQRPNHSINGLINKIYDKGQYSKVVPLEFNFQRKIFNRIRKKFLPMLRWNSCQRSWRGSWRTRRNPTWRWRLESTTKTWDRRRTSRT